MSKFFKPPEIKFNKVCPFCNDIMAETNAFCSATCFNLFNGRPSESSICEMFDKNNTTEIKK